MSRNDTRRNKKGSGGVPDRWLDYKPVGRRLAGTRFIAFKVPLKQSLNRNLQTAEVFGPWDLLDAVREDGQELGLVIDLTNTARYYDVEDLPESLTHVKIKTAGHEVPSDANILSFKRAVHSFLQANRDNDTLIGVHCTHGLNRTGYLICRYLIDVDGMEPARAVELFNSSRGHAIERQNYLTDLSRGRKRSNKGMRQSEQEPARGGASSRPRAERAALGSGREARAAPRFHPPGASSSSRSFREAPRSQIRETRPQHQSPLLSLDGFRPPSHRPHPQSDFPRPPFPWGLPPYSAVPQPLFASPLLQQNSPRPQRHQSQTHRQNRPRPESDQPHPSRSGLHPPKLHPYRWAGPSQESEQTWTQSQQHPHSWGRGQGQWP